MLKDILQKRDTLKEAENYTIVFSLLLYFSRTAIPFLKYPFLLLYSLILIYVIIKYHKNLISATLEFSRVFYLIIILLGLLTFHFFFSNKIYLVIFKDLMNWIILISYFIVLLVIIRNKDDLKKFSHSFINSIVVFVFWISLYRLFDLFSIFHKESTGYLYQIPYSIEIGSLQIDYNFAILPIILGMISIVYHIRNVVSSYKKLLYTLFLSIYSLAIFFSGSRRGLIVLSVILILLTIAQFLTFSKKDSILKNIGSGSRYFILTMFFLFISGWVFIFHTSYDFKNKTLEMFGTKNLVKTKGEIAMIVARYYMAINPSKSFTSIYELLWTPVFNPNDPDSGWGSRMHKTVYPLSGANSEIVPASAKGYYLNRFTNADTLNGNAYSATWITNHEVDETKVLIASVYCYVSDDCDFSLVEICSIGAMGNPGAVYDWQKKGTWQKLEFSIECKKGNAGVLLFLAKNGVPDFSSVKGYVIFAYPEIKLLDKNNLLNTVNLIKSESIDYPENNKEMIVTSHVHSKNHPHEAGLSIQSLISAFQQPEAKGDDDPLRRWFSRFISEDTTYTSYTQQLFVNEITNQLIRGRLARWKFAIKIFSKEYNLKQKLFGGGFKYLNWFGSYFLQDRKISDYPHNPFLSVLLYSGIIGLLIYLYFMYKVFYYYIIYFKEMQLITVFFLIIFFFSFFSAGSPLDPPIMGFFVLLPFFINHIHKLKESF